MVRILLSTRLGERRWTQADLARMTGIRPNTISEALGCELTDLIVLTPNSEPRVKTRTGAPRSKGED